MLLLTGPAGSGKTTAVLQEFRSALAEDPAGALLVVPTATMAEHLRNRLARDGLVFRPGAVTTFSKLVGRSGARPALSPWGLLLAVERALERLDLAEYRAVAGSPGLSASLVQTISELSAAGCGSAVLPASTGLEKAFMAVFAAVEQEAAERGCLLPGERTREAAARLKQAGLGGPKKVWMDGFLSLTDPELAVVEAVAGQAELTVTLPLYEPTAATRNALLAMGFREQRSVRVRPEPRVEVFSAATRERETAEIARRVAEEARNGRPFREIGIVVRSSDAYLPALRAALERSGIPARFYFSPPLARHGTLQLLLRVVEAMLAGWDWEQTLAALRLAAEDTDWIDFEVRKRLPGRGLEGLKALAGQGPAGRLIEWLEAVDGWRGLKLPPEGWADRIGKLAGMAHPLRPREGADHETALLWRGQAAAVEQFAGALEEAAGSFPEGRKIPLAEFWQAAKTVLATAPLLVPDHRRNVAHVMSVYEARQWELPVIFVCGLVEKQFPRHHFEDPVFPDASRQVLQASGFRVRTSREKESEEAFLFELARTRAVARLVMSYPRSDGRDTETLPSFFLSGFPPEETIREEGGAWVRRAGAAAPQIGDPGLLALVGERHAAMRPTGLETFLQCPYRFFARETLRLEPPPPRPRERLDPRMQGSIVHKVLARFQREGQSLESLFERVFEEACREVWAPPGYRTESLRLQLLGDLRRFLAEGRWLPGPESDFERAFEWQAAPGLLLRGRIDRLDRTPGGEAVVVDYKYWRPGRVKEVKEDPAALQGPLYALGCRNTLGLEVAGVFYISLKKETKCAGWGWGLGFDGELSEEWLREGLEKALRAAGEIRAGRIEPRPSDPEICEYCEFRDVCRYE